MTTATGSLATAIAASTTRDSKTKPNALAQSILEKTTMEMEFKKQRMVGLDEYNKERIAVERERLRMELDNRAADAAARQANEKAVLQDKEQQRQHEFKMELLKQGKLEYF